NASTGVTLLEYVLGFNLYNRFNLLNARYKIKEEDYKILRLYYKDAAEEAVTFA
ncbi:hypothetical protein K504DRAFT_393581, partial [Pleomassaria siparia CBS 279.74]